MTQFPMNNQQFDPRQQVPQPPPPQQRPPRWRFRWEIVAVLAAIMVAAFIVNNIEIGASWGQIAHGLDVPVRSRDRHAQTVVLGLVIVGVMLFFKEQKEK